MNIQITIYLLLLCALAACSSPEDKSDATATANEAARPPAADSTVYEPLPYDTVKQWAQAADYIDIIFNNMAMSVAVDQKPQVQSFFYHFSRSGFVKPAGCRPDASAAILSQGMLISEANIYVTQCQGIEWIRDGQVFSGNVLNRYGISYYNDLLEQGRKMMNQQRGN